MDVSDLQDLFEALSFAAIKHSNQRRKGSNNTPYINHPIDVARRLLHAGVKDSKILTAAVLHDTVEDTDTSFAEIAERFGEDVASLVKECTDDKSLPKAERKRLQIVNADHKSDGAKCIKIADKISNVAEMGYFPPSDWDDQRRIEYLDWAEAVVKGLSGVNPLLDQGFAETVAVARKLLTTSS